MNSEWVIESENIRHTYDGKNFALKGVTFNVRKGEVFGLLGKNGAGKSTLIKILTTLIKPTEGNLRILGMDPLRDGTKIRSRIGVVQQGGSFEFTTVEGNFDVYGVLWDVPKKERNRRKESLIKMFDLEEVRKKRVFDLSGGQVKRVQVAREFMHEMDILFLDEPTIGLDIVVRRNLLDYIRSRVNEGLTVVFTTHNLEEADYLCDRIAVIDSGKILALDTVENLKKLYGGKRTIEVSVNNGKSDPFFEALKNRLDANTTFKRDKDGLALILTENPKEVLQLIIEVSQLTGAQVEWLNVRKNTLEDVFLDSISKGGVDSM
jgi:ABC-2 type transport system ATP-binding protein